MKINIQSRDELYTERLKLMAEAQAVMRKIIVYNKRQQSILNTIMNKLKRLEAKL